MPIHKRVSYVVAVFIALTLFSRETLALDNRSVVEREIHAESLRQSKIGTESVRRLSITCRPAMQLPISNIQWYTCCPLLSGIFARTSLGIMQQRSSIKRSQLRSFPPASLFMPTFQRHWGYPGTPTLP
jgi:hypothetical protein